MFYLQRFWPFGEFNDRKLLDNRTLGNLQMFVHLNCIKFIKNYQLENIADSKYEKNRQDEINSIVFYQKKFINSMYDVWQGRLVKLKLVAILHRQYFLSSNVELILRKSLKKQDFIE